MIPGFSERTAVIEPRGVSSTELVKELQQNAPAVTAGTYEDLFRYLLEGFVNYRSQGGAHVYFPGEPSEHGRTADGLEGFSRFMPLAAAWLGSGRPSHVVLADRTVDVAALMIDGLLAGTDPRGSEYWGQIYDYDQAAYEAGDIVTALWISRDRVWRQMSPDQRRQVSQWLRQVLDVKMYAGNWSLSTLLVYAGLKSLGENVSFFDERAVSLFDRFRTLYRGEGWFSDPPHGMDFYNSWAIHYNLFWINRMLPNFQSAFIRQVEGEFGQFFKHLFGPNGHPMYGRSVCYRLGASAGLLSAAALAPKSVSMGEAMRALDSSVRHFGTRGAFSGGAVTQGFCGANPAVIDVYAGPGSCQMGLRALVLAFFLDPGMHSFSVERQPLPVERGDFSVRSDVAKWTVNGRAADGNIDLIVESNPEGQQAPLQSYTTLNRIEEFVLNRPRRPDNHRALYESHRYSTAAPGLACERVKG